MSLLDQIPEATLCITHLQPGDRVQVHARIPLTADYVWRDGHVLGLQGEGAERSIRIRRVDNGDIDAFKDPLAGRLRRLVAEPHTRPGTLAARVEVLEEETMLELEQAIRERDEARARATTLEARTKAAEDKQYSMLTELRAALADTNTWTWGGTVKRVMDMRHTLAKTSLMRDAIQKDANTAIEQRRVAEAALAKARLAPGNYEGYLTGITVVTVDYPEPRTYRSPHTGEVTLVRELRAPSVTLDIVIAPGTTRKVAFVLDAVAREVLSDIAPTDALDHERKRTAAAEAGCRLQTDRATEAERTLDTFTRECGEVVNACGATPDRGVVLGWLRALKTQWDVESKKAREGEASVANLRAENTNLRRLDSSYAKIKQDVCDAVGVPRQWNWDAILYTAKYQHNQAIVLSDNAIALNQAESRARAAEHDLSEIAKALHAAERKRGGL